MTSLFSLDKAELDPVLHLNPIAQKPGSGPGFWGVAEPILSQLGSVTDGGKSSESGRKKKKEAGFARMESECLLEQARWPAWSFHLRSSGFYIPAMHQRSHHAEEVVRCSVHTRSHKSQIGGVEWPFREL